MNAKQKQLEKAERALYEAKARAEQAADHASDCERKVWRLREELGETAKMVKMLAAGEAPKHAGSVC